MNNKSTRPSGTRRTAKTDKRNTLIIVVALTLIVGVSASAVIAVLSRNMTNTTIISMIEYKDINPQNINIILEDRVLEEINHFPMIIDDTMHLPVDFIQRYVDTRIFWEPDINLLTITTPLALMRIEPDNYTYFNNFNPRELDALVHTIGSIAYLPLSLIHELYDVDVTYSPELNMIIVDYTNTERIHARVVNESAVRHNPDKRSYIAEMVSEGDMLIVFEQQEYFEDEESAENARDLNGHLRVRTTAGNIGYILDTDIQETSRDAGFTRQPEIPVNERIIDGRINMTWDLLTNLTANTLPHTRVHNRGVNVLSPTWFSFDRETYNGDVISLVDRGYVEWAHSQGIQVWPLVFDYEDPDVTGKIMTVTAKRDHVIRQFIDIAEEYNLDGINIDFERIRVEEINYFLQFLRELSPMMRERDLVLSVAVFVPAPWTMFFNRPEIARVADFLTVMTYDETVSGQPSGPNASIGFVHRGVVDTLAQVPSHQIIMGVPFYTRIWREVEIDGEITNSVSRVVGVQLAYNFFAENNASRTWLEDYGYYYVNFTTIEDGQEVTYRAWIECERSIELKMQFIGQYDLAGVASWTRGLATPGVWDVIYYNLD